MRVHVERFLAPLQGLRRLKLIISNGAERSFLDAYRWEIFLLEHLPRLLTFNFKLYAWDVDENVIDQYRRPFWLDKHWYVACDSGQSFLFTVPYFIRSSMINSSAPVPPNCTTLPIEQHRVFYDRVTELRFDSDRCKLSYCYNHIQKLILNSPYIHENILDLSKVQTFIINTSEWSFDKIVILIKEAMPSVSYLRLNCTYLNMRYEHLSNISLGQIRLLSLPQYGRFEGNDAFNWSGLFPCVERLIASINSKSQIRFLIDHFKKMVSGFFVIHPHYMDTNKPIQITRQWLEKHTHRLKEKMTTNFTCQINDQYSFSLCLWIGENDELDQQPPKVHDERWWRQCFP